MFEFSPYLACWVVLATSTPSSTGKTLQRLWIIIPVPLSKIDKDALQSESLDDRCSAADSDEMFVINPQAFEGEPL